jgi:hypothetical protein
MDDVKMPVHGQAPCTEPRLVAEPVGRQRSF